MCNSPIQCYGNERWDIRRWIPAFEERRPWNEGRLLGEACAETTAGLGDPLLARSAQAAALCDRQQAARCDVVKVRIGDIVSGGRIRDRAIVVQQKTKRPVQFELLEPARKTMRAWLERRGGSLNDYVFPSRNDYTGHMSTRQYARLVHEWVVGIGLQPQE